MSIFDLFKKKEKPVKEPDPALEALLRSLERNEIVMEAVENKATEEDDFILVDRLCEVSGVKVPNAIEEIRNAKVRHTMVCDKDKMQDTVTGILGLK